MIRVKTSVVASALLTAALGSAGAAAADYGPGVTDTEIKIGSTTAYSGPVSAYGTVGRLQTAYYEMINAGGGINGRKVKLISLDDAYTPAKAVEQTRRLVEQDEVLAMVGSVGTVTNSATQKYLNGRKVPQILVISGAAKWDNPTAFPWSTPLYPSYRLEALAMATHLMRHKPDAKLALLSQNDDAGRDYIKGFKEGLGAEVSSQILKEMTYEPSEPTIDSQIVALKATGADTVFMMATPKFGAQAIRKIAELNWKPQMYVASVTTSIETVLKPAGVDNAVGVMSAFAFKRPEDPRWANDPDVVAYKAFLERWYPAGKLDDSSNIIAYISTYVMTKLLERCGDNLTRDNLMAQATTIDALEAPLLLPGVTITTTPRSVTPFRKLSVGRFDGTTWVMEGEPIDVEAATR
ncbi:ABC transporter substrate-binding protein [Chelatococcus reniformis]|uniref:ABC transporter substrate-binding protein n=1 Tax=Chelatococcus reniformis TaxID=1494448 RepID=A0A916XC59_9HYPH|nr:ABC transporter substrate-binding protein [Chelatococcus reniformis]GGC60965.1 ABC transporter substrate-binding protein [Chelatococcus reniformis]